MPSTYADEPLGLKWINNLNPTSFGIFVSQAVWLFGSGLLSIADYRLLLGATEQHRQAGLFLAGILVGAWTGKTIANVVDAQQKRALDPRAAPVIEAKTRAQVQGSAAIVAASEATKDAAAARASGMYQAPVTADHLAQPAPLNQTIVNVPPKEGGDA